MARVSKLYGDPAGYQIRFDRDSGELDVTSLKLGATAGANDGTAVTATAAELNLAADASVQTETVTAAGAVSVTKRISKIGLSGAGAVTLAAPDSSMLGVVKLITMSADNGDVTLALTNVQGQSSGTTATFNDVGDSLVLIGGISKWHVIGESGISLA